MSTSENKEIVRRYWDGRFNEKNDDVVDEFFPPGEDVQRQKAWLGEFHAAWGDTRVSLDQLVAEDDLVVVHCTFVATHVGEWEGVAPSGRRLRMRGMALCRLRDGKIVEDDVFYGEEWATVLARPDAD